MKNQFSWLWVIAIVIAFQVLYYYLPNLGDLWLPLMLIVSLSYLVMGKWKKFWEWFKYILAAFIVAIVCLVFNLAWYPYGIVGWIIVCIIFYQHEKQGNVINK